MPENSRDRALIIRRPQEKCLKIENQLHSKEVRTTRLLKVFKDFKRAPLFQKRKIINNFVRSAGPTGYDKVKRLNVLIRGIEYLMSWMSLQRHAVGLLLIMGPYIAPIIDRSSYNIIHLYKVPRSTITVLPGIIYGFFYVLKLVLTESSMLYRLFSWGYWLVGNTLIICHGFSGWTSTELWVNTQRSYNRSINSNIFEYYRIIYKFIYLYLGGGYITTILSVLERYTPIHFLDPTALNQRHCNINQGLIYIWLCVIISIGDYGLIPFLRRKFMKLKNEHVVKVLENKWYDYAKGILNQKYEDYAINPTSTLVKCATVLQYKEYLLIHVTNGTFEADFTFLYGFKSLLSLAAVILSSLVPGISELTYQEKLFLNTLDIKYIRGVTWVLKKFIYRDHEKINCISYIGAFPSFLRCVYLFFRTLPSLIDIFLPGSRKLLLYMVIVVPGYLLMYALYIKKRGEVFATWCNDISLTEKLFIWMQQFTDTALKSKLTNLYNFQAVVSKNLEPKDLTKGYTDQIGLNALDLGATCHGGEDDRRQVMMIRHSLGWYTSFVYVIYFVYSGYFMYFKDWSPSSMGYSAITSNAHLAPLFLHFAPSLIMSFLYTDALEYYKYHMGRLYSDIYSERMIYLVDAYGPGLDDQHIYNPKIESEGDNSSIGLTINSNGHPFIPGILGPVNLILEPGSRTCIIGPSGVGKTTFCEAIAGYLGNTLTCDYKSIQFQNPQGMHTNSRDMDEAQKKEILRSKIKLLPQTPQFYNQDIYFNVNPFKTWGPQDRIVLNKTLERYNLHKLVGTNIKLLDNANNLSGGEKQRLAFIRLHSLFGCTGSKSSSPILIFDEPVSSLDSQLKSKLLSDLASGSFAPSTTMLVVLHDPSLYDKFKRVLLFMDGQIAVDGAPSYVMNHPTYKRYLEALQTQKDVQSPGLN